MEWEENYMYFHMNLPEVGEQNKHFEDEIEYNMTEHDER